MKTRNKRRKQLQAAKQALLDAAAQLKQTEEAMRQQQDKRLLAELRMKDMMQVVRERDERISKLISGPARYFRYDAPPSPAEIMQTWRWEGNVRVAMGLYVHAVRQCPQGIKDAWINEVCLDFGRRAYEEAKRQIRIMQE